MKRAIRTTFVPGVILSFLIKQSRTPDVLAIILSLAAFAYLFTGHINLKKLTTSALSPVRLEQPGEILGSHEGFEENAVYARVAPPRIGGTVRRFGSWVQGDVSIGRAETAWFVAVPAFSLQLAGYPNSHDCELYVEAQTKDGVTQRIAVPGDDPMETWQVREVLLPRNAARFRVIAIDHSSLPGGWLGFSQPFRFIHNMGEFGKELTQILLCFATAAAALVAILLPGFWLRRRMSGLAFLWIPVPGFLILAMLGLLCWVGPAALGVRLISQAVLGPVLVFAIYHAVRFPLTSFTNKVERRVLLTVLLITCLSVSKAIYSVGPEGELYGGQISRTLEVGNRSDSRIPFHVLQLIATRSGPYGALADVLFGTWGFSARTPLVALAATPVALALPFQIPQDLPDENWTVYDPEGFAAFRIVMIVIACCGLTAAYGVAKLFVDEQWALLALLVTATAPFVIHETYFTWPKLEAAWFVLLTVYALVRQRFLAAGLLWSIAYLCHPLALLVAPGLLGVVYITEEKRRVPRAILLISSLALGIGIWATVNYEHFNQPTFLNYFAMADGGYHPSVTDWLRSRWNSIANTLIPLYLVSFHGNHYLINSLYKPSPPVVRFYFQYWNTLPFGVGITYFFFMARFLAAQIARRWMLWVFLPTLAFFTLYWGAGSSGMLREGLHPWVLGLLVLSVVVWQRIAGEHQKFSSACRTALCWRLVETLLMLVLPAIVTSHKVISSQFLFSDSLALAMIAGCGGGLFWMMREDVVKKREFNEG